MITTEVKGDDICKKLYDLAHHVRAQEDRKRQKIISDDGIQDDVVGILHKIGWWPWCTWRKLPRWGGKAHRTRQLCTREDKKEAKVEQEIEAQHATKTGQRRKIRQER
jgi:hypothetical protein